jgi:hypothetical protein
MSDYSFGRLVRFWVESVVAHISAIEMCSNGGIVGLLSSDNTSPVTCASELEVALRQALDVLLTQQVCRCS